MKEEKIFFPSSGFKLEGLISTDEAFLAKGGVILCHPHPQYGGDMHNSIILSGVHASWEAGLSTLRFNFRGVGESGGAYSDGIGEKEDVQAAIECLNGTFEEQNHFLILVGYSFGAWAGMPIAAENGWIKGMVAIAPPLEMYDFGYLKGCPKKKLIVAGNQDLFCPLPLLEEWYQQLADPKSLLIVEGADHFFSSHQRSLLSPLREFFRTFSS